MAPPVMFRIIGVESPIHHAVRLMLSQGNLPTERTQDMSPTKPKARRKPATTTTERATPRKLKVEETIRLSDWLRTPGRLDGLVTFVQVAEKVAADRVLDPPPSVSSVQSVMNALGLKLASAPVPLEQEVANLREAVKRLLSLVDTLLRNHQELAHDPNVTARIGEVAILLGHDPVAEVAPPYDPEKDPRFHGRK